MKFGGTSVGDVTAFERVFKIVSLQTGKHPVVVVSAMTKVTDALLAAFETAKKGEADGAFASLEPHFERHAARRGNVYRGRRTRRIRKGAKVCTRGAFRSSYTRFSALLPLSMLKDAVVSYGEQLSSRLLAEVLKAKGLNARQVDSRRLIVTDDEYGAAQPFWDETEELVKLELEPMIGNGEVPVMGGFIAASRGGETTTLGRGGSDYSAAIVAAALNASELQIWTDVTGVMTCDPRICPDARTIPVLSYEEAAELAYFGAKVLHPKTIKPAVDHRIPVRVCNTSSQTRSGRWSSPSPARRRTRSNRSLIKRTSLSCASRPHGCSVRMVS